MKVFENVFEFFEFLIKYVYEDMGFDEFVFFDLCEFDFFVVFGLNFIMFFVIVCSECYFYVFVSWFVKWFWKNYKVSVKVGGLIGFGEFKIKFWRLCKKVKFFGINIVIVFGGDNGIFIGWVCVNFMVFGG